MKQHHTDQAFSGTVPGFYDTCLVPLIFEPYANDLATRRSSGGDGGCRAGRCQALRRRPRYGEIHAHIVAIQKAWA